MALSPERIRAHTERLVADIGPRVMGTRQDQEAIDYIAGQIQALGLPPRFHRFECPCWEHRGTELTLVSSGESLPAQGSFYSVPCDVTGDLVVLDDLTAVNNAPVAGKICLLSPRVGEGVSGRNIVALALEARGAAATIVDRGHARPDAHDGKYIREPDLRSMPVACVSRQVAEAIRAADSPLRLAIDASFWWGHTYNVEVVIPGAGKGRVFIAAHHDTAPCSPGASDDAASVAIALELARAFSRNPPPCDLRVVFTGGHERLEMGAAAYVRDRAEVVREGQLALSLDGIGPLTGLPTALVCAPDELVGRLTSVLARQGDWRIKRKGPRALGGDATHFAQQGVPSVWLETLPQDPAYELFHTQFDDLAAIDLDLTCAVAEVALEVIRSAFWRA